MTEFFVHFGFWHFIGLMILIGSVGGGVRKFLNYRLGMRKIDLRRLKAENNRLHQILDKVRDGDEGTIRMLTERVETLETIATSADEDLNRKLRELSA
jgi:hypothetical protein